MTDEASNGAGAERPNNEGGGVPASADTGAAPRQPNFPDLRPIPPATPTLRTLRESDLWPPKKSSKD